jgi:hypothetical protein
MERDQILEELWAVKDRLARDSGYDVERFFDELRCWETTHPEAGPFFRTNEELRRALRQKQELRAAGSLNDKT